MLFVLICELLVVVTSMSSPAVEEKCGKLQRKG